VCREGFLIRRSQVRTLPGAFVSAVKRTIYTHQQNAIPINLAHWLAFGYHWQIDLGCHMIPKQALYVEQYANYNDEQLAAVMERYKADHARWRAKCREGQPIDYPLFPHGPFRYLAARKVLQDRKRRRTHEKAEKSHNPAPQGPQQ
jgi:hypothetical protein